MSKEIVIKAENISKQYRLGEIGTGMLSHDIRRWWAMARGKEDPYMKVGMENDRTKKATSEYAWALRDVSFEIGKGDSLGIIGNNGAGKSTLLKLLSRVTGPSSGEIKIKGRIASLLEVGTGFHPDLTGRENIFMNGTILGMTRKEIVRKLDEIVEFAGIEMYLDTPVKRYSSGMYVRLAFGVAAHLEPEILIVDEVLAVGDAEFQKKCLGKMKDVSVNDGRTVIFVSHNMSAVQSLCNKAIMMEHGMVKMNGSCAQVINHYLDSNANSNTTKEWSIETAPGNEHAKLLKVELVNTSGEKIATSFLEDEVYLKITYRCITDKAKLNLSISIMTNKEECVLSSPSITDTIWCGKPHPSGDYVSYCKLPSFFFNNLIYSVYVVLVKDGSEIIASVPNSIIIEKTDSGKYRGGYFGPWSGITRPILEWKTERV